MRYEQNKNSKGRVFFAHPLYIVNKTMLSKPTNFKRTNVPWTNVTGLTYQR